MAACCAELGSNCTRRSPKRSKPISPSRWTASPSSLHSITPRPGSSKNLSSIGARPVGVRRPLGDGGSGRAIAKGAGPAGVATGYAERHRQELELCVPWAVLHWAQRPGGAGNGDAYARARELWEQLGSPSEFLQVPYGQSLYHASAANSIWRCAWARICCGSAVNATIPPGSFWVTPPPVGTSCLPAGLRHPGRIWRRCLRFTIRFPTARLFIRPASTLMSAHGRYWGLSCSVSAFPTRRWSGATQQSLKLGSWLILIFGSDFGIRHQAAFARRRRHGPRRVGRRSWSGDDRAGFPLVGGGWNDL